MNEDIDHLDFDPVDPDLKMALDASARILKDPRNFQEAVDDEIDPRLLRLLHGKGVIEADGTETFTRDDIIEIARKAYFQGSRDHLEHPEVFKKILKAATKNGPGLTVLDTPQE